MAEKKGFTVWFSGLPSSGKTTIARLLEQELRKRGYKVEVLDGDIVREYFSKGLGFSREDRIENLRRIAYVAHLLSRNGVAVITAAVSPYQEARDRARQMNENFLEVYVKCPVEVCIQRDVKGLYKKALAGEIKNFTGISDPFEEPEHPEVICESDKETPEESMQKVIHALELKGFIESSEDEEEVYSEEEEELVKKRLEELGYL